MNRTSFARLLAFLLLGRFALSAAPATQSNETIRATAKLVAPLRIEVKWSEPDRNVAGHIVEWATDTNGDYTILAFCRSDVNSFVHPDLAPDMTCYYRIRPYFGPVSDTVEIKTGKAVPDDQLKLPDATWSDPKTNRLADAGPVKSIRNAAGASAARPTGLHARLVYATGILLTWADHASDEEGYMVETKFGDMPEFSVCALTPPDVTSFGYPLIPAETKAAFRVRAYYYGKPSNVAAQNSGAEPAH
jgi:hypothetical protein